MDGGESTSPIAVDLLVEGAWVITMDARRRMIRDGAVAVRGHRIVDVGPASTMRQRYAPDQRVGGANRIVLPGFVNAHQHLTGDRLVRSAIPDDLAPGSAIFTWAVPIHAAHTPDDDELSAVASLAEAVGNGITFTVEAGTVAHPDRVLAALRPRRRRRNPRLVGLGRRRTALGRIRRRRTRPPALRAGLDRPP